MYLSIYLSIYLSTYRYENPVGARQLQGLTAAQRAKWIEPSRTEWAAEYSNNTYSIMTQLTIISIISLCTCYIIVVCVMFHVFPCRLPVRTSFSLTACRKESRASFPLPPTGPFRSEGTTLSDHTAAHSIGEVPSGSGGYPADRKLSP